MSYGDEFPAIQFQLQSFGLLNPARHQEEQAKEFANNPLFIDFNNIKKDCPVPYLLLQKLIEKNETSTYTQLNLNSVVNTIVSIKEQKYNLITVNC